jgi:uncharacterized protein YyaL (SSP411 family)
MIRFAAAALLASLLAGTAMAQTVSGTANSVGNAVSGAASATGKTASSAATSVSNGVKGTAKSASAMVTGEYADEASAKAHCPTDTVVWANTSSKAYHMAGTKYYGKTKKGAYMCQKDADASGFHAPKAKPAAVAKPAAAAKTN